MSTKLDVLHLKCFIRIFEKVQKFSELSASNKKYVSDMINKKMLNIDDEGYVIITNVGKMVLGHAIEEFANEAEALTNA